MVQDQGVSADSLLQRARGAKAAADAALNPPVPVGTPTPTPTAPKPAPVPAPTPTPGPGEPSAAGLVEKLAGAADTLRSWRAKSVTDRATSEKIFSYLPQTNYVFRNSMAGTEPSKPLLDFLDTAADRLSEETGIERDEIIRTWAYANGEATQPGWLDTYIKRQTEPGLNVPLAASGAIGTAEFGATNFIRELGAQFKPPEPSLLEKLDPFGKYSGLALLADKLPSNVRSFLREDPSVQFLTKAAGAAALVVAPEMGGFWLNTGAFLAAVKTNPDIVNTPFIAMPGMSLFKSENEAVNLLENLIKAGESGQPLAPAEMGQAVRLYNLAQKGKVGAAEIEQALGFLHKIPTNENVGALVNLAGKDAVLEGVEQGIARLRTFEGQAVQVPSYMVRTLPEGGVGAGLAEAAQEARVGTYLSGTRPFTVTPGGLWNTPVGTVELHGTTEGAGASILGQGVKPSTASPGTFNAIYTTTDPAIAKTYSESAAALTKEGPSVLHVEVPINPKSITADAAEAIRREMNIGPDWQKLSDELRSRGYQVVETGKGARAWLNPEDVRPIFAASPNGSFQDLVDVAKGLISGDSRMTVLNPMAGGAPSGYMSPQLKLLLDHITNNEYDRSMLEFFLTRPADQNLVPGTLPGKLFRVARSGFGLLNPGLNRFTVSAYKEAAYMEGVQALERAPMILTFSKLAKEVFGGDLVGQPFLSKYVGEAATTTAEKTAIGTFFDAIERPAKYAFNDTEKTVLDLWKKAMDKNLQRLIDMGIPVAHIDAAYAPWRIEDLESEPGILDRLLTTRGATRFPGPTAMLKTRQSKTFIDFVKSLEELGVQPELDPMKAYVNRLVAADQLASRQMYLQKVVQAYGQPIKTGAVASPGWQEVFGLSPALKTVKGIPPEAQAILKEIMPAPTVVETLLRRGRWQIPGDVAREVNMLLAPQERGAVQSAVEQTVDALRATLLSIDLSAFTQHGYALFAVDPVNAIARFGDLPALLGSPEGSIMHMVQNWPWYVRFVQAGGSYHISPIDIVSIPGKTPPLAERIPIVGTANKRFFGQMIPAFKIMQFKTAVQMLENIQEDKNLLGVLSGLNPKLTAPFKAFAGVAGKSQWELDRAAADFLNNVGGGINWAAIMSKPTLAEKLIFLTPGWLRANVGRITSAARVGDPRGVLARRFLFQSLALTSMLSSALSMALAGRLPSFDPRSTDFLDIQTPTGSIPILPGKVYIRTIFRLIGGKPGGPPTDPNESKAWNEIESRVASLWSFSQAREGQVPGLMGEIYTGHDVLGRKVGPIDMVSQFLPLILQGIQEDLGQPYTPVDQRGPIPLGPLEQNMQAIVQGLGLNFVPKNPFDARSRKVQDWLSTLNRSTLLPGERDAITIAENTGTPMTEYGQLTDLLRARFDKTFPEYTKAAAEYQEIRDSPYAQLRGIRDQERFAVVALGKAMRGEPLTDEEASVLAPTGQAAANLKGQWRNYSGYLSSLTGAFSKQVDAITERKPLQPQNVPQKIVANYYTQVVQPSIVAGTLNGDLFDYYEREYRKKVQSLYGDAGTNVLDAEVLYRTTDDPTAAAYHQDSKNWGPYFDYLNTFWTAENRKATGIPAEAGKYASFNTYQAASRIAFTDEMEGKPLPSNVGNYRSSPSEDSIYKRFGITPGRNLTHEQADAIANELVRLQTKNYQDRLNLASTSWLAKSPDVLCALDFWGKITVPAANRPQLALCKVRP